MSASAPGMPAVLTDPATEPEAAHLRNVLRQIQLVVRTACGASHENAALDFGVAIDRVRAICDKALTRPQTNGAVIDALTKENGDLQSEILELRERLRQYRETTIVKGQVGQ